MPKEGIIVLVPFPFTDLSATKVRPAVVLSTKSMKSDIIVAFISSKQRQGEYDVAITPSEQNGLKVPSVIICSKLATLEVIVVLGELGVAEFETMKQVKTKLSTIFGL
jgi:mRNA interferase MazF